MYKIYGFCLVGILMTFAITRVFSYDNVVLDPLEYPTTDEVNAKMDTAFSERNKLPINQWGGVVEREGDVEIPGVLGTVMMEMFTPTASVTHGTYNYALKNEITQTFSPISGQYASRILLWDGPASSFSQSMLFIRNNDLGIGIMPTSKLHVAGDVAAQGNIEFSGALQNANQSTIISPGGMQHMLRGTTNIGGLYAYNTSGDLGARLGGGTSTDLELHMDRASILKLSGGKVGIGVEPNYMLEVLPQTSASDYCDRSNGRCVIISTSGNNSVLTHSELQTIIGNPTDFPDKY